MSVQISEFLELLEDTHKTHGDIAVLKATASEDSSVFSTQMKIDDCGNGVVIESIKLRLTKKTARKLGLELLNFAQEEEELPEPQEEIITQKETPPGEPDRGKTEGKRR